MHYVSLYVIVFLLFEDTLAWLMRCSGSACENPKFISICLYEERKKKMPFNDEIKLFRTGPSVSQQGKQEIWMFQGKHGDFTKNHQNIFSDR